MVYKPTQLLKKLTACCLLLLPGSMPAQSAEAQLAAADSLFQQRRYTQALQQYRAIEQQGYFSDAMLLRMAYMEEGLGNAAESLVYLHRFWLRTGDRQALEKIQETALKYNWLGYDYPATDRVRRAFFAHRPYLAGAGVLVLALLLAAAFFVFKKKLPGRAVLAACNGLFALALAAAVFWAQPPAYALVAYEPAHLMAGPSAGAPLLARLDKGHRIPLKGAVDVWIKTEWKGTEAYVRQSNIRPI